MSSSSESSPTPIKRTLTVATVANVFVKLRRARHDSLDLASGVAITHPSLSGEGATCKRRVPLIQGDFFVCKGAVDVAKLLRGSRASLLEKAEFLGANVLIEESWVCHVRVPKNKRDGKFRVQIRYYASASRSSLPDPHNPVALDKALSIPGLMTIVQREEFAP